MLIEHPLFIWCLTIGKRKPKIHISEVMKLIKWKKRNIYFILILFFKDFIYLFMRDTERERDRDTGRGRNRLHAGSRTGDLIPCLQDHALA